MRLAGGVDIGGTRTKLGVVREDGTVVVRTAIPTREDRSPEALVERIAVAMQALREKNKLAGVGVSVAGFLDRDHEKMFANANLPELWGFALRKALEKRLRLVCRLEVDSNASTLAEYRFGAGRGSRRLLGVTIGTGLGGGVVVDGQLLRYTGECAGDLGHVLLSPTGRRCTCGAHGCLEAMVCSAALSERVNDQPVQEIVSSAMRGNQESLDALAETGWWLGLGLASLSPLFAPDRIVIGGGVAAAGECLLDPARMSYRLHASADLKDTVQIVGSTFDGWEGMVGAASLFLDPLQ